ncbi:MAG: hypothetical protein LBB53_02500 [Prevotellaceae bacterium]|jgi:CxxC motif-containing protein (DUF1111 family)|nr:hypothetical protein [Prevotellaceae bacterium]
MQKSILLSIILLAFYACNPEPKPKPSELSEEYYAGGQLGTVFNETAAAYEQPTPAVEKNAAMSLAFKYGEALFEKEFTSNTDGVRNGLGPVMVRSSCISCHPNYGHGKRTETYNSKEYGNGYLLVVTDANDNYVPQLTGMPQTQAVYPFLPPIDEKQIVINWLEYQDDWHNRFPDGETYSLIYPEVTIPSSAFNVPMPDFYKVRLESTIGIYGTGLLDAIPDDSIIAQYYYEKNLGFSLNDAKYNPDNFIKENDGTAHPGRYTYGLTRGTLQNGPGSNAIWNITNVNREGRPYLYTTKEYAQAMSENADIQAVLGKTQEEIYNMLAPEDKNHPDWYKHNFELATKDYVDFMIWHRGLAVPAARNLDNKEVKRGRELFYSIGCTACHRPKWTTGADNYTGDTIVAGKLPQYPYQKIFPYTDLLQHRLRMMNDIRTGWCRTTPLWGRGLSQKCTGASDHLHDMRARNYIEAIMWHGSQESDARRNVEKFRNLSKADREALIKFLESI